MTTKVGLTVLALLPLLFIFLHPNTNPGDTTLQHRAELIRVPVSLLASSALVLLPKLIALMHWLYADWHVAASAKQPRLDLTCVRLC